MKHEALAELRYLVLVPSFIVVETTQKVRL